jgi:hypothetical protein
MITPYDMISEVSIIIETCSAHVALRGTFANIGYLVAPQHRFC